MGEKKTNDGHIKRVNFKRRTRGVAAEGQVVFEVNSKGVEMKKTQLLFALKK
ncbi:hypothetical protein [Bacillus sp. LLTC93]|uniref:hypothetical protein n=1 Tax=Bacillus sp. LLTC93 TaxID=2108274 RepID=UPI00166F99F8|nr:hypothetical protein [Bacillus sp. LLTC93]